MERVILMEHILGHFLAFFKPGSTSHNVETKSQMFSSNLNICRDNSNASNEAEYEPPIPHTLLVPDVSVVSMHPDAENRKQILTDEMRMLNRYVLAQSHSLTAVENQQFRPEPVGFVLLIPIPANGALAVVIRFLRIQAA